ncbi:DMP19 family protein [Lysobacter sp. CA199]|uniref:DMP19 family protein n=1 Tax=Lysobacter sp. CA199 TaxID=3455608 RepID=UPI003F8D1EB7
MQNKPELLLPDTILEDRDEIAQHFFEYIHEFDERRHYPPSDDVPELNAYCALYYEYRVNNGGHRTYVLSSQGRDRIREAALAGLDMVGATEQAGILRRLMDWTKRNPGVVAIIIEGRISREDLGPQPELDQMDEDFFRINRGGAPSHLIADWVLRLPGLKVVTQDQYDALINGYGVANSVN